MTETRGIPRRDFLKSAVAIGGTAAFGACIGREEVDVPTGPEDPSSYPQRQHAWNDRLPRDDHGNVVLPHHHVLLYLNYATDGQPTDADRETIETALRGVEHAHERSGAGLLLTVGYTKPRRKPTTCRHYRLSAGFKYSKWHRWYHYCIHRIRTSVSRLPVCIPEMRVSSSLPPESQETSNRFWLCMHTGNRKRQGSDAWYLQAGAGHRCKYTYSPNALNSGGRGFETAIIGKSALCFRWRSATD